MEEGFDSKNGLPSTVLIPLGNSKLSNYIILVAVSLLCGIPVACTVLYACVDGSLEIIFAS